MRSVLTMCDRSGGGHANHVGNLTVDLGPLGFSAQAAAANVSAENFAPLPPAPDRLGQARYCSSVPTPRLRRRASKRARPISGSAYLLEQAISKRVSGGNHCGSDTSRLGTPRPEARPRAASLLAASGPPFSQVIPKIRGAGPLTPIYDHVIPYWPKGEPEGRSPGRPRAPKARGLVPACCE